MRQASQHDEVVIRRYREERWPEIKKDDSCKAYSGIRRRIQFLPTACGVADLGSGGPDIHRAGASDAEPSVGHQRYDGIWKPLLTHPPKGAAFQEHGTGSASNTGAC